jgi:uncharacterized protein YeaO (DUF488 family)
MRFWRAIRIVPVVAGGLKCELLLSGGHMVQTKRVYEPPGTNDGLRILVDYLWPRGLKKEEVKVNAWTKAVAPSTELRQWFGHDPAKWKQFERRYFSELEQKPEVWKPLLDAARTGPVTLVFSARDEEHNNAVALKKFLERRLRIGARSRRQQPAAA